MRVCTVSELEHINYSAVFVNSLQQFWHTTKYFQCIGSPKKQNLFLFLDGCRITYTDKSGRTFSADSGDIVYTPMGGEYRAQLSDFSSPSSHTVGINFFLLDETGEQIILSDEIKIFRSTQSPALSLLFHETLHCDVRVGLTRSRILLMEILCTLGAYTSRKNVPDHISSALRYLSEHIGENPTVAELAARCNISEVYFRKQFKCHTGMTPLEYRNSLRFERARSYLEYGDISVQEISDMIGYSNVSHFIGEFKKQYGCSPLRYRKLIRRDVR